MGSMESPLGLATMHWDHEPRAVSRPPESVDKSDALQTLRAVQRRSAVAKRLECVRLQRRFPTAGCDSMAGMVHGGPLGDAVSPLFGSSASGLTRSFGDAIRVARAAQRGVVADLTAAVVLVKAVIHQHHAVPGAGLDAILQLMQVVFANQIADGAGGDEELIGQHAA